LVHQFRRDVSAGHPPPFSTNRLRLARRPTAIPTPRHHNSPHPPSSPLPPSLPQHNSPLVPTQPTLPMSASCV
jgi:hypothetical protein